MNIRRFTIAEFFNVWTNQISFAVINFNVFNFFTTLFTSNLFIFNFDVNFLFIVRTNRFIYSYFSLPYSSITWKLGLMATRIRSKSIKVMISNRFLEILWLPNTIIWSRSMTIRSKYWMNSSAIISTKVIFSITWLIFVGIFVTK